MDVKPMDAETLDRMELEAEEAYACYSMTLAQATSEKEKFVIAWTAGRLSAEMGERREGQ